MRQNKDVTACALDIGSGHIKAALGRFNREEDCFKILAVESVSPSGVTKGVVSEMAVCTQAIAKVLEEVELKAGVKFNHLFLAIPTSQIGFEFARGVCLLEKETRITNKEVNRAIKSSVEFYLPLDRKLIQVVAKEFIVDGQKGITDPEGMFARKIEAYTIILHSQLQATSNLITAVEEAGYTLKELIACPIAQAEFLLSQQEKERGAVIVDIGSQTIDFSYFKNKFLSSIRSFNIGINEATRNISSLFNIPHEYARELSERYLSFSEGIATSDEEVLLKQENGDYRTILRRDFCSQATGALGEVFGVMEKHLKKYSHNSHLILCGGAVLIDGFSEKLEKQGLSLKIGSLNSESVKLDIASSSNPLFLTSISAAAYGYKLLNDKFLVSRKNRHFLSRILLRTKELVEEYF